MFKWILKLAAKKASKKLGLQEGKLMDAKKWYQSKAVLSAIIACILGGVTGISTALNHPIVIPDWVYTILVGLGLYGLRTGDKPIE